MTTRPVRSASRRSTGQSEFVAHLESVFRDLGPVQARRMFGGHGVYHGGVMFALVADEMLYLKADAESAHHFRAAGCAQFEYVKNGRPMKMSYFAAPEAVFDDPDHARWWGRTAYAAALRARGVKR